MTAVYIWASLLSWLSRELEETAPKWMPGCVMTQALMDIIKKEFPFDKFELKDELMSSCSSFLMFVMCLYLVWTKLEVKGHCSQTYRHHYTALKVQFHPKFNFDLRMLWGLWPPYYTVMFGKIWAFSLAERTPASMNELTRDQISGLFSLHLQYRHHCVWLLWNLTVNVSECRWCIIFI